MSDDNASLRLSPLWLHWPETEEIIRHFDKAGAEMRFVGGAVRDTVLDRMVTDVDIATPASPETVMKILQMPGIKVIPTGLAHGTVTAVVGKRSFEITTLRRDVACDGRRAEVEYTDDWLEDASRRDFTMNALYMTPKGHVWDYFGGIHDARLGVVRFIGDANQRIREDALRILRFFRFYAHYGISAPDTEGLEACTELAHLIKNLSGERIQTEMLKTLAAPEPVSALNLMQESRVLDEAVLQQSDISRLQAMRLLEKDFTSGYDAIRRLALLLRSLPPEGQFVRLEALAHRWKLSNAHKRELKNLLEAPAIANETECKRQIRLHGREHTLHMLMMSAAEGAMNVETLRRLFRLAKEWSIPAFPVTGNDLKARGIGPGVQMGETLRLLEKSWEDSDYRLTKDELIKSLP